MTTETLRVGCAEAEIPVPLFTELYGYGPFLGRRNRGVRDPLMCRAVSFGDGSDRLILITSDLVTMDPDCAWEVRNEIGRRLDMPPTNIMLTATHTHSGPTISRGIGWGELDRDFQASWVRVAVEQGVRAAEDESPVEAEAGRSALSEPLGYNRVDREDGPTDPDIRWLRSRRPDGKVKLLLHNHGMHAVVFGPKMRLVSADWPGEVNRRIVEEDVAEHGLFLPGPAGNVNTIEPCKNLEEGEPRLRRIGEKYVADLRRGLDAGGEALDLLPLRAALEPTEFPTHTVTPESLRADARKLRELEERPYLVDRLEEMALFMENGGDTCVVLDLQVLRLGDVYVYAFPGEPFVELGFDVMRRSPGRFALAGEVANGNGRYFPTPEVMDRYPSIAVKSRGAGYYEIQGGAGRFMPPYQRDVAPFAVGKLLEMAGRLSG